MMILYKIVFLRKDASGIAIVGNMIWIPEDNKGHNYC